MKTDKIIDQVQDILREVGATLISMREIGAVGGTWQDTQLKSDADLAAEAIIIRGLRGLSIKLPVVSEENLASHTIDLSGRHWLVDPIDGTASFCGGYSGFVTQLALMEGARPVLGVVYCPAQDLMYVAEKGGGACVNGFRIVVNWQGCDVVLTDNYPEPRGIAQLLYEKLPCAGYLESGSIGLKICLVADGRADLFVKDVTVRNWDLAPGHLILTETGGDLVDLHGHKINYGESLVQTTGLIAAASRGIVDKVKNFIF